MDMLEGVLNLVVGERTLTDQSECLSCPQIEHVVLAEQSVFSTMVVLSAVCLTAIGRKAHPGTAVPFGIEFGNLKICIITQKAARSRCHLLLDVQGIALG